MYYVTLLVVQKRFVGTFVSSHVICLPAIGLLL